MAGTRKVRMIVGVSGYRHDGEKWPPAGEEITVPAWEADDLIRGGNAVPCEQDDDVAVVPEPAVTDPRPPSQVEAEDAPVAAPEPEDEGESGDEADDEDDGESGDEAEDEPREDMKVPSPGDPKQAWIDYAVSQGAEPDKAAAMTKADLMSRYGGRL